MTELPGDSRGTKVSRSREQRGLCWFWPMRLGAMQKTKELRSLRRVPPLENRSPHAIRKQSVAAQRLFFTTVRSTNCLSQNTPSVSSPFQSPQSTTLQLQHSPPPAAPSTTTPPSQPSEPHASPTAHKVQKTSETQLQRLRPPRKLRRHIHLQCPFHASVCCGHGSRECCRCGFCGGYCSGGGGGG